MFLWENPTLHHLLHSPELTSAAGRPHHRIYSGTHRYYDLWLNRHVCWPLLAYSNTCPEAHMTKNYHTMTHLFTNFNKWVSNPFLDLIEVTLTTIPPAHNLYSKPTSNTSSQWSTNLRGINSINNPYIHIYCISITSMAPANRLEESDQIFPDKHARTLIGVGNLALLHFCRLRIHIWLPH